MKEYNKIQNSTRRSNVLTVDGFIHLIETIFMFGIKHLELNNNMSLNVFKKIVDPIQSSKNSSSY